MSKTEAGSTRVPSHPRQADYDLERVIKLFDEALISKDDRVINALRSLLMIVTLTAPEVNETAEMGPLRSMQANLAELDKRVRKIERVVSSTTRDRNREELEDLKYQSMKISDASFNFNEAIKN